MLPIGDDKLINARKPYFTWLFMAINILVFLYQNTLMTDVYTYESFVKRWAATPAIIMNGEQIETLLTCIFLHGGWLHLIGNMLFLYVFGDNIEAVLGHLGFAIFYLISGVAAALAHVVFNPDSTIPSLGASGAISACLGAYLVMFPRSNIRVLIPIFIFFTTARVSAWVFLGIWILIQVLNARFTPETEEGTGGVAWFAHIGGFVIGLLTGVIYMSRARHKWDWRKGGGSDQGTMTNEQ